MSLSGCPTFRPLLVCGWNHREHLKPNDLPTTLEIVGERSRAKLRTAGAQVSPTGNRTVAAGSSPRMIARPLPRRDCRQAQQSGSGPCSGLAFSDPLSTIMEVVLGVMSGPCSAAPTTRGAWPWPSEGLTPLLVRWLAVRWHVDWNVLDFALCCLFPGTRVATVWDVTIRRVSGLPPTPGRQPRPGLRPSPCEAFQRLRSTDVR
jgi:hypothetical protein